MDRNNDPAHIRLGINLGSAEDGISTARLMTTLNEVLSRALNLIRLLVIAAPIVVQCFFIHTVDFGSWLARLLTVYALLGSICFIAVPEQLYNGMGLGAFKWIFEKFYPEIALSNGSLADPAEQGPVSLLAGRKVNELQGVRARLRWHGTSRYLCVTRDGWIVTGDESFGATLTLQQAFVKEKKVPDTYSFCIADPAMSWNQCWLSFKPINHLRFGGWLGAFRDAQRACPYKVIQDSSCPPGAFKLLCAETKLPPPTQRSCTGFYVAEQLCGSQLFVGHAPDRDAALLEFVLV